jgi:NADH dehydrogenase
VLGEVLDAGIAGRLVAGCDACINLIGIIREVGAKQSFRRMHVETPRALLEACEAAGVRRFVQMSAMGVNPEGPAAYQKSKFEGEQVVKRARLDWTIFRPSLIHGPEAELVHMIRDWASGSKQPFFFMPYFARERMEFTDAALPTVTREVPRVAPVSVEDVALCFAECIERRACVGEIYNLTGSEELSFKQMLEWWRDHLPHAERSLSIVPVPAQAASIQAKVAKLVGLGGLLPFDEGMPLIASEDSTANMAKLEEHLGVKTEGFSQSAGRYVETVV